MNRDNVIAKRLNEIVGGIQQMIRVHKHLLEGDYPARHWTDGQIFGEYNGSALTDDPVYEDKKELSIYLRGRWDGEYHIAQNILGNLERYADVSLSDDELAQYESRVAGFWADILNQQLSEENAKLKSALKFIHEMVYESLRTDELATCAYPVEAIAAEALGLSDAERDIDFNADDKMAALIRHITQGCEDEVAAYWKSVFVETPKGESK